MATCEGTPIRREILLLVTLLVLLTIVTAAVYLYVTSKSMAKPAWLKLGAYTMYEQTLSWTGHKATEYMTWNITKIDGDFADLHLVSHGVDTSSGSVVITEGEADWTLNAVTREIVSSSDSQYIGEKNPFWIEKDVALGSHIEISYGPNTISKSESITILGRQRDCWVVEYRWSTSEMTRWYDKSSGIVARIHVVLYRPNITIEITETAIETNTDLVVSLH